MLLFFQPKDRGLTLFNQVCEHLTLLECDYFGLEYVDAAGNKVSTISQMWARLIPQCRLVRFLFGPPVLAGFGKISWKAAWTCDLNEQRAESPFQCQVLHT